MEGQKAPAFKAKDQDGKDISLADFKGKKLAIYFYPKDMTPTCTVQACNLRDNFSLLKEHGIEIIGISPDDEKSHKKFESRHDLPFRLVADPSHKILEKYGVWVEKKLFGHKYMGVRRTTFLIDEKGKIVKVIGKPKSGDHAKQIIREWKKLQTGADPV